MSDERNIAQRHRFACDPGEQRATGSTIFDVGVVIAGCVIWALALGALLS